MSKLKTCNRCGRMFIKRMTIGGVERNLSKRELCFQCRPLGRNEGVERSIFSRQSDTHITNGLKCVVCDDALTGKQRKYCSISCKIKVLSSYPYQKERGLQRKIFLVMQSGGECQNCGYDENLGSLAFHHREPESKKFNLNTASLAKRTWKAILKEYEKCDLLCANCHSREHARHFDNWNEMFTEINWDNFKG